MCGEVFKTTKAETQTGVGNYGPTALATHSGLSQNQHTRSVVAMADWEHRQSSAHIPSGSC